MFNLKAPYFLGETQLEKKTKYIRHTYYNLKRYEKKIGSRLNEHCP
jgi:hypothetical protein